MWIIPRNYHYLKGNKWNNFNHKYIEVEHLCRVYIIWRESKKVYRKLNMTQFLDREAKVANKRELEEEEGEEEIEDGFEEVEAEDGEDIFTDEGDDETIEASTPPPPLKS